MQVHLLTGFIFVVSFHISSFSQSSPKVAIIGGGMAGISAAHHIHETDPSASITIFEKEKILGGNAKTVSVPNAKGEMIKVDAGPQYFTEGPWDEYIKFLKIYNQYKPEQTSEFVGSIVIQTEGVEHPRLVTPLNGSFRGEKLGQLLRFKKFFDTAYLLYKDPNGDHSISVGKWVEVLPLDITFKEQIVLPFLASSLGTSIEDIKKTAAADIVKLFAFRKPSNKSTFKVMIDGMGTLIQNIGDSLHRKGLRIMKDSPVKSVTFNDNIYTVTHGARLKQDSYDFVVLAVHADIAYKLLKDESNFNSLTTILKDFKYFVARIVLHGDDSFVNKEKPAFMNIVTSSDNQLVSNTMSLGMINERYQGIYKSWLSEDLANKVKTSGKFYHEEVFYHPLITPEFNAALSSLNKESVKMKSLCFAGGWSQGLETQETAVISGQKAADKYRLFKENK